MRRSRIAALLLVCAYGSFPVVAEEPSTAPAPAAPAATAPAVVIPDADVEAALEEAGKNRPELERVLKHFADKSAADPHGVLAARFLIANMPGKGYIVTALKDAKGNVIPYDPLAHANFEKAQVAYEALEKEHGKLDFKRDRLVKDVETLTADYLIKHVEAALDVWQTTPAGRRVGVKAFLEYVLPYRGSEEPAEDWLGPTRARLTEALKAPGAPGAEASPAKLWRWIHKYVEQKVHFNERYYLHPTDQGFAEMEKTRAGRCEDITNMTTYCARALGLATAADYTPAWGHRDNNHAWNVLLDANGRGSDKAQAHAAKVYRKVFSIQKDSLSFQLPKGREPPNRFLASKSQIDVTEQYQAARSAGWAVEGASDVFKAVELGYVCVFSGGDWIAVDWVKGNLSGVRSRDGVPTRTCEFSFPHLGTGSNGMLYMFAVPRDKDLVYVGPPQLVLPAQSRRLNGEREPTSLLATAVAPSQKSADTHMTTPVSHLREGVTYVLHQWALGGWKVLKEVLATKEPLAFEDLSSDGLYWLVEKESRRLERPFTIENGRQRFW